MVMYFSSVLAVIFAFTLLLPPAAHTGGEVPALLAAARVSGPDRDGIVNDIDQQMLPGISRGLPGPSGLACAGAGPCPPPDLKFAWPFSGDDAAAWVINNYVDLDAGAGILDYMGGSKSYNGHQGIDIDVPTFRAMDTDVPVLAVAQGTVLALEDSNFDRNTSCTGNWNFVTVGYPSGWRSIYGHLKQDSVVVNVGDVVDAGTILGVVGSSGCSTQPHLHLETVDNNGDVVDPFQLGMWLNPPVYATSIGLMDVALYNTSIDQVGMIKDPPPNASIVAPGTTLGVGLSMGGGMAGDVINLRIYNAMDALVDQANITFDQVWRHSYWWWNYTFAAEVRGFHELEILVNGTLVQTYRFAVDEILSGFWQARHGVPAADYQALFNTMVANGYRPVWVDGYDVNQQTFFNVIFDQSSVASWASAHGLNASDYQAYFDTQVNEGRRLVHIDSYRDNGAILYAPIFVEQPGTAWTAYHGVSLSQHQSLFDTNTSQGYRAAIISLEQNGNGDLEVAALYDQENVGGWVALANLNSAQYQTQFDMQTNAGLRLSYLNGYTIDGIAHFSAIWNSIQTASWVARHDLTSEAYQNEFDTWNAQGLTLRFVTGYENNAVANFGAYWTD